MKNLRRTRRKTRTVLNFPPRRWRVALQDEPIDADRSRFAGEEFISAKEMSRAASVVNVVVLAILSLVAVCFLWLMSSLPRIEGRLPIHGLELPASVARDAIGVPQITARTAHDAYFILGWVHAQDRMWQMELQRRVAAGRLAEIVGEKALASDRFMRTLGLAHLAEAGFARLDKPTRDALTAYAQGVNAWVDSNHFRLPLEFAALGHRPEPWRPADSLMWARLMGLQLAANWQDDILRAKLAAKFDAKRLGELFPGTAADSPVTLSAATADALLAALPEAAAPRLASNLWIVDGRHTVSGKPLLANDPHLPLAAPVQWYLASIESPGLSISGATIPGIPFHLIGRNQRIAWGLTATHADTVDLFIDKLTPDGTATQSPSGARRIDSRTEVIKVKGGADVELTVRQTYHGPVISDLIAKDLAGPDQVVALQAAALEPEDLSAQAFYRISRAVDWNGFLAALKDYASPVQNFGYADTAGNIGFITAGRIPIRKGDGSRPSRGWTGQGEWIGWIPFAKLPQTFNPKSGVIVNANNKVVPASYPYAITAAWPDGYRAQRITDLLTAPGPFDRGAMAAIQLDAVSLAALELKDLLSGVDAKDPTAKRAAALVAAWDGRADRDRSEPLIFNAWVANLWRNLLQPHLGADLQTFASVRPGVLAGILTRYRHWCGDGGPQPRSCDDLIAASLDQTVVELAGRHGPDPSKWRWGDEHLAVFANQVVDRIPVLSRLSHLEIATDGDDFTVNRGTFAPGGFTQVHGAGMRTVFDLADPAESRFVLATGQSGNPLSRNYGNQLKAWRANQGYAIAKRPPDAAVLSMEPGYKD